MLCIDAVLYFLLTIYFDNVIQGEFGTSKPLWFCLSPAYWRDKRIKVVYVGDNENEEYIEVERNSDYEPIPEEFRTKVALR